MARSRKTRSNKSRSLSKSRRSTKSKRSVTRSRKTGSNKSRKSSTRSRSRSIRSRPVRRRKASISRSSSGYNSKSRSTSRSLTRGWKKAAPKRGKERHALKKKCGAKCFLDPKNEKFPICQRLTGVSHECIMDCRAVKSAYIRARQWGYDDIANRAQSLYRDHCE